ncbi:MAG TPA: septal ring lytic transglycosylase RlpA family protein [Methyloprofundus sp.]|uniref:septal ring lytic transglycosylase RlpA family protein n=1 Tax=Methyloprofundus sp. TaxID=2020875 RepID=UPI00183BAA80|nr:septal ring lytic transglycosylase RlpA family protein [Methyloprofundus sp.]HIG65902.1 septal ring lytic transglycosylase RlpA family protein [Methyloprofundus sp.]HIL77654.1 septal ring lytic transglycosylase RlpA family protein [Methylococcales bacterium]
MNRASLVFLVVWLSACSAPQKTEPPVVKDGRPENIAIDVSAIPDAVPRYEPWSASVNPESYVVLGVTYHVLPTNKDYRQQGVASWYGTKFHQKTTASGDVYDMWAMTAAHKTLPIPSYVQVTNLDNQRSIIVRVNDRGPFHAHRIIDLSFAAATKLGLDKAGTGFVDVVAIQPGDVKVATSLELAKKVYYQVGAFATQENAALVQESLTALQLKKHRVVTVGELESKLFKVQIGPISSVTEADIISAKLKAIGLESCYYIAE